GDGRAAPRARARVHHRHDGAGQPAPQALAAQAPRRAGMALPPRAQQAGVHRAAHARRARGERRPRGRAGPLRRGDRPGGCRGPRCGAARGGGPGRQRRVGVVTVGGALVVYAFVVGFAGPAWIRRSDWPLRAPRLGAAAVVAAAWSVPVALVLAGVTVFLPTSGLTIDVGQLIGACLVRLRAAYGTPAGAGVVTAGQVLTVGLLLRGAWTGARFVHRRQTERRRHRLLVRWAGAHVPDLRAVVLEQPGAAAFAVGGAQHTVVVTRGAVDLLSGAELSA